MAVMSSVPVTDSGCETVSVSETEGVGGSVRERERLAESLKVKLHVYDDVSVGCSDAVIDSAPVKDCETDTDGDRLGESLSVKDHV